ncbi:L,D-transpeptidase family protein [Schaalia odontolytica]|mgnify:FL=1|uniref:L,D-transpeptidase family protein n=2 Tax=Schaalia odontolytica TaxID=1660 RepID=A0A857A9W7_9ACTO|nr:L,D-transpeptidase family protein [Schaalia odontolytica]EFF79507.1 ErfK/YbiS/YcfS/YnhG [Schaalia odontolytica F0309]QGS11694.1 L,D-transpeptidase family protein [Schaalia odontolytica]
MLKVLSLRTKWAIGVVSALVLLVVCAGVVYAANYSGRALPGTSVAGTSVAGMTRDQVVSAVNQRADATNVTLTVEGKTTKASLNEAGISVNADETADAAMKGSTSFPAFVSALFSERDIEPVVTVSEESIKKLAASVNSTLTSEMKDASVIVAQDGQSFTVTPAQMGNGVSAEDVAAAVKQAGATLTSVTQDVSVHQMEPSITTENAQAAAEKANALLETNIEISDGIDTFSAERSDKVQWIEFLTKDDGSLDTPSISTVKVADWVNALAATTDVKPQNRVDNVDSSGNVLTVAREGKKGLKTNNTEQVTKDIIAAMTDGKAYEGLFHYDDVEPGSETKQVAEGTENLVYQAAEGEKWVDISLADNSVTAYIGGKVAGGPYYMVPGAPDTPTVTGTFHVYLKYDVQTMRGENADGTKYETEGVPWVTYFTGSYAMHGAPWRSSFGWSGYGGSHGCVNMPVDAAKFIYDWTDMGDTVVVHY